MTKTFHSLPFALGSFSRAVFRGVIALLVLATGVKAGAQELHLDPDLTVLEFDGPTFIPFVYNFRTDQIHWTVGYGAKLANGNAHPLAAQIRQGIHADILAVAAPTERRDWGGGGFVYDPRTRKLMIDPAASVWSISTNDVHWSKMGSSLGLIPWQYVEWAMRSAATRMGIGFQALTNPPASIDELLAVMRKHRAFPARLSEPGQRAMAEYLNEVSNNPQVVLNIDPTAENRCANILSDLTDHHPTTTPAVLGRGRLGSMILE